MMQLQMGMKYRFKDEVRRYKKSMPKSLLGYDMLIAYSPRTPKLEKMERLKEKS